MVAPCTRAVQPLTKASGLDGRLRRTPRHQDDGKVPGVTHAGVPGQRLGSRKALSLGGSRERSGRGEFFMRSRMIGTTFLNLSNADAASKSQKPHFTSRQSCGGYRVKKLGASPSSRPLRRPAAAPPLSPRKPLALLAYSKNATVHKLKGAASAAEKTQTKFR